MPDKPNTERPQRIDLGPDFFWLKKPESDDCGSIFYADGTTFMGTIWRQQIDALRKSFAAAMAPQDGLREALEEARASAFEALGKEDNAREVNDALDSLEKALQALAASPAAHREAPIDVSSQCARLRELGVPEAAIEPIEQYAANPAQHEAPEELTTAELIRAVSHAAQPDITSIAFTAAKDVVIDGKLYKVGERVILPAQHEEQNNG